MGLHRYILILVAVTLNDISAQSSHFKIALINDLNATCIEQKGLNSTFAASTFGICLNDALLQPVHKLNYTDRQISLICTTDLIKDCNEKAKDVLMSCLPEDTHEIFNHLTDMEYQMYVSLCANDAEYLKIFMNRTCEKQLEIAHKVFECGYPLRQGVQHLMDLFTEEKCQKYKEIFDCLPTNFGCPDVEHAYNGLYTAMAQASPCNI